MDPSIMKIVDITSKDQGVVATVNLKANTLILSEEFLFSTNKYFSPFALHGITENSIEAGISTLTSQQKEQFFALKNSHPGGWREAAGLFATNALPLGGNATKSAIFLLVSKFNHSCSPNALYTWNELKGVEEVRTLKGIAEGEEITVNYLTVEDWWSSRTKRQEIVQESFNFERACNLGAADEEIVRKSDARRLELKDLEGRLDTVNENPEIQLKIIKKLLELYRGEGDTRVFIFATYTDGYCLCATHSDYARAVAFARLVLKVKLQTLGDERDDIETWRRRSNDPDDFDTTPFTTRWKTAVEDARAEGEDRFEEWLWERCCEGDVPKVAEDPILRRMIESGAMDL